MNRFGLSLLALSSVITLPPLASGFIAAPAMGQTATRAAPTDGEAKRALDAVSNDPSFIKALVNRDDKALTALIRKSGMKGDTVTSSGSGERWKICLGKNNCYWISLHINVEKA